MDHPKETTAHFSNKAEDLCRTHFLFELSHLRNKAADLQQVVDIFYGNNFVIYSDLHMKMDIAASMAATLHNVCIFLSNTVVNIQQSLMDNLRTEMRKIREESAASKQKFLEEIGTLRAVAEVNREKAEKEKRISTDLAKEKKMMLRKRKAANSFAVMELKLLKKLAKINEMSRIATSVGWDDEYDDSASLSCTGTGYLLDDGAVKTKDIGVSDDKVDNLNVPENLKGAIVSVGEAGNELVGVLQSSSNGKGNETGAGWGKNPGGGCGTDTTKYGAGRWDTVIRVDNEGVRGTHRRNVNEVGRGTDNRNGDETGLVSYKGNDRETGWGSGKGNHMEAGCSVGYRNGNDDRCGSGKGNSEAGCSIVKGSTEAGWAIIKGNSKVGNDTEVGFCVGDGNSTKGGWVTVTIKELRL